MNDENLALETSRKAIKITLITSLIVIMLGICLAWIMLNNTAALAQLTKEKNEMNLRIDALQKRVGELEKK